MSALGQERKCALQNDMSALPLKATAKADMGLADGHVRLAPGPKADIVTGCAFYLLKAFPRTAAFDRSDAGYAVKKGCVMTLMTTRTRLGVSGHLIASLLFVVPVASHADEIRILSGGGPQEAVRAATPEFEKTTGHQVRSTFALVTVIQQKLAGGEKADLILLPVPLIAATEKSLPLRSEGRVVLARVGVAVIVRKGATPPDISTSDAIRKILLDAKSIAFPPPNTPVGGHLARMIEQLGVADAVRPKLVIRAAIDGGAELVAKGEADVGMYLLSEIKSGKDINAVGLLPPPLQHFVVYGAAIPAYNDKPEAAVAFVKFLSAPNKKDFWKAAGFEPVSTTD
jgi:molybdate transport system substrate-binding protein